MGITYARDPVTGLLQPIRIDGDAPTETEVQRINDWQRSRMPAPIAAPTPVVDDNPPGTAIGRSIQSGIGMLQQLGGEALEGIGADEWGPSLREAGIARQQEVEQYRTRLEDVEGIGSALTYAGELGGEQLPIMAPTIAGTLAGAGAGAPFGPIGATVGGIVGGALASYPLLFGGNRAEQREMAVREGRPVEIDNSTAALAAIPQAALEGVAGKIVALGFRPIAGSGLLTRVVRGAGEGALAEIPTEIGQEMIQIAQAGGDVTSDEAIRRYIEAGVAAGVLGGGIGGVSGGVRGGEGPNIATETPVGRQQFEEDQEQEAEVIGDRVEGAQAAAQRAAIEAVAPTSQTPLLERPQPTPQPETRELPPGEGSIELPAGPVAQPLTPSQVEAQREAARIRGLEATFARRAAERREASERAARVKEAGGEIPVTRAAREAASARESATQVEQERRADDTRQARAATAPFKQRRVYKKEAQEKYGWDKAVTEFTAPDGETYIAFREEGGGSKIPPRSWGLYKVSEGIEGAVYAGENQQDVAKSVEQMIADQPTPQGVAPQPEQDAFDDITGDAAFSPEQPDGTRKSARTIPRRSPQPEPPVFGQADARPIERGAEPEVVGIPEGAAQNVASGRVRPAPYSPEVKERINTVRENLRKALDNLGLKDVGLRVSEVLNPDLLFQKEPELVEGKERSDEGSLRSLIEVATEVYGKEATPDQIIGNAREVLSHEIIHAMRSLGLFTDAEWKSLVNAAKNTKYVRNDGTKREYTYFYRRNRLMDGADQDLIGEEAVADMFRDWSAGRLKIGGKPQSLFKRIMRALRGISEGTRDVESAAEIFNLIEGGEIGGRERGSGAARPFPATPDNIAATERHSAKVMQTEVFKEWANTEDGLEIAKGTDGKPAVIYRGVRFNEVDPDAMDAILYFKPRESYPATFGATNPNTANTYGAIDGDDIYHEKHGLTDSRTGMPQKWRSMIIPFFARGRITDVSERYLDPMDIAEAGDGFVPIVQFNKVDRDIAVGKGPAAGEIWVIRNAADPGGIVDSTTPGYVQMYDSAESDPGDIYILGPNTDIRPVFSFRDQDAKPSDTGTPAERFSALRRGATTAERALSKADPQRNNITVQAVRGAHKLLPMISDPDAPVQRDRATALLRALRTRLSNGDLDDLGGADEYLMDYSNLQAKVPVHNAMQWRARAIPMAIAEGKRDAAIKHIDDLLRNNLGEAKHYQEAFDQTERYSALKRSAGLPHVHFVGFRGEEYNRAKRVWGEPDFIHLIHDHRMYGDVGENDIIVFGPKADPEKISEYSWQDHERWSAYKRKPLTSAAKLQVNPLVIEGTGPGGRILKQDYGRALTRRHMDMHGRKFDPAKSEQDFGNVSEAMYQEYMEQMSQQDDGLGWYTADVARAMGITEQIIPALNPRVSNSAHINRDLLMLNAALTSPQERPVQNWEKAVELTERYLKEGSLPLAKNNGKGWGLGENNIRLLQFLIKKFQLDGATQWVQQMHSGRDIAMLRKESGLFNPKDPDSLASYKASEVGLTSQALGVYMFGPKVGDFFLNVSGIDPAAITVDIWAGQNFNRHIGRLMDVGEKALADGKIASSPRGVGERNTIKNLYRDLADKVGQDPSAVQAALWYFEQRLERSHGINAPSQTFSEAAEVAARKRNVVPTADAVEGRSGVRPEDGAARVAQGTGPDTRRSAVVLRRDGAAEEQRVVSEPRYTSRGAAEANNPVTEADLYDLNEDFFRRPGWGVVTANRPDNAAVSQNPVLAELETKRRTDRFREYLNYMGLPYREVTGFYKGNDEGLSFLVLADEATMIKLGKQNQQESIITSKGLIYTNINAADTPATGEVYMDDEARAQEGYTEVGDQAFSLGLDWDIGPGIAQVPENFYFHVDRPQLPINKETGLAELHHFSDKRLDTIDPVFSGTGTLSGPERRAGWKASFFGINPRENYRAPGTGYVKEDTRWKFDHVVEVNPKDLYPWYENPDGIDTGANRDEYHANIKEAGYKGYYITDDGSGRAPLGNVAVMYEAVPVTKVNEDSRASSYRLSQARTGPGTGNGMGATTIPRGAPQLSYSADQRLLTQGNGMEYSRAAKTIERILGVFFRPIGKEQKAKEYANSLIQKFQDAMLPFGEMMDELRAADLDIADVHDVYMNEELMHGKLGAMLGDAEERLFKPFASAVGSIDLTKEQTQQMMDAGDRAVNGKGYLSEAINTYRARERTGLNRIKEAVGFYHSDKLAIADAYLYAKHAKSRNAFVRSRNPDNDAGSGMTDAEADAILGFVNSLPQAQRAKFERISTMRGGIVTDTNRLRKQKYGLVDEDVDSGMTDYVPLRGKQDPDGFIEDSVGPALSTPSIGARGREDRQVTGRKGYATSSIVAELIAQNQRAISRGERNDVGKSLLGLLREFPEATSKFAEIVGPPRSETVVNGKVRSVPKMFYDPTDQVLTVKENGENRYIKLKDHRLGRAIGMSMNPQMPSAIVNKIGKLNRYLANVNTSWNIEFLISNAARDIETAMVNAGQYETEGVSRDILKGIRKSYQGVRAVIRGGQITDPEVQAYADAFRQFQDLGGQNVTNMVGNLENIEGRLRGIMADINEADRTRSANLLRNAFIGKNGIGTLLEDYNTVVENMTRVSFFKAMVDRGASPERAAQAARNLTTNFAKGGEWKNGVNAMYLFYNASLQGSWALLRAATRSKKVQKMWAGVLGLGVAMDLMNAAISGEDEDGELIYDKIYDYDLEHNIILMDPFGISERGYFKFPMAYGLNMAMNIGRVSSRTLRGAYDPADAASSAMGTVIETVWPFGGQESWGNAVAPTVLDPFVDLLQNENFAGQPIYKEEGMFGVDEPTGYRHFSTTGKPYVAFTKFMNDITGGNEIREGVISPNPDVLEYWVDYAFGATGATVMRAAGTIGELPRIATGQAEEEFVRQVPLARRLFSTITEKQDVAKFFDRVERVETARKEIERAIEVGDREWAAEVRERYGDELRVAGAVRDIVNARNRTKRQMREIERNPNIPEERKQQLLEALRDRLQRIVARGNEIMRDL